ncbi:MAG: flavodoxin-dependent (E)-4-hydroxy-3-methylbut-2-enyl-diphosphate synthase [bacterium]
MSEIPDIREVRIGTVTIGGGHPVAVQSMTSTDTRDIQATLEQIHRLEEAGCEIVRVAVPDEEAVRALRQIKKSINIPLVADIHFHYRLALAAIEVGADKIRINPGNIGGEERLKEIAKAARDAGIPLRIGINAGSLERDIVDKYHGPTAQGMVESARRAIDFLEQRDFHDMVISLKASDVRQTVEANVLMRQACNYPLHLGVTEAGTLKTGPIRSAIGIGALLLQGIGETLRISLTADPVEEVHAAWEILKALRLRSRGPMLIACPMCGRCEVDLIALAEQVEQALAKVREPIQVAVMGCVVNGPGEAREADFAIVGGKGKGLVMKRGEIVATVAESNLVSTLLVEIDKVLSTNGRQLK